jgi:ATP citrate (pro-S)-lyase
MIVVLGELGGEDEYSLAAALAEGRITKPVVAWVSGTCAPLFGGEVQFGHAGARSGGGDRESAAAKNKALADAGATVPTSFEGLEAAIKKVWDAGVAAGAITPRPPAPPARALPADLAPALKAGTVRVPTNVVCTISDDRGEEPCYGGVPMSSLLESGAGIADAVSLLWFKRRLPPYATRFIELCIILCADHGPCVSGAHVSIVTARAGKDLVSSLAAGLLTIGPRFGGAVDGAARRFGAAFAAGQSPAEYVEAMKAAGERVPGIGHRIKSKDNRDARVKLLQVRDRCFESVFLSFSPLFLFLLGWTQRGRACCGWRGVRGPKKRRETGCWAHDRPSSTTPTIHPSIPSHPLSHPPPPPLSLSSLPSTQLRPTPRNTSRPPPTWTTRKPSKPTP